MTQHLEYPQEQISQKTATKFSESTDQTKEPIAIIGMGCRFPGGANSPEAFWKLLRDGVDAITEVPADRWNVDSFYDPDGAKPGKIRTRWGGFIDKIDEFDAEFFGISPREAFKMDPQQRLLLEVAWEALEDGGQVPENLAGSKTGVFIGISASDYYDIQLSDRNTINAYTTQGGFHCIAANRISYIFNFNGPSMAVDTACSSALVAVHLACQSIWNGESTLALAGGVNALLKPEITIGFSQASMLSPDGRCKTFDAKANGYVRAEGAGIVVLKPLESALADGDTIYAVIRGSAVNQDGHTNGITVPSGQAQEAAIREACKLAGISPEQVQYVETHGTGTSVGDPIEAIAIGNAIGKNRSAGDYCTIGSVKTNMGHLESASGVAGLIKLALALKHRQIPPSLHFHTPNPKIPFEKLRLRVPTALEPWLNGSLPRLAGINSFGFGGTNAHIVVAEAPENAGGGINSNSQLPNSQSILLPLSARSSEALKAFAAAYKDFLTANDSSLSDICYTSSLRRGHHNYRLAVAANSKEELAENLEAFLAGETRIGMSDGRVVSDKSPKLAFVFSGMGQQWWAMGRTLLEEEPLFREAIQRCDELLRQYADWSLLEELTASEENSRINSTVIAQCAIFSVQVALAALWRSWGIIPEAIVGHSVGEVAAAHVAGVLSLEDAVRVIFYRSRLQAKTAGLGKMLAVGLSVEEAQGVLVGYEERVSIAAINSSKGLTLAGESLALEEIAKSLELQQIFCRFLQVEVPYHSPLMEPLKAELTESLQEITPQEAAIPLFSTVTGLEISGLEMDGAYWAQNMRNPVLFAKAVEGLMRAGYDLFLEIGAHPVLASYISECSVKVGKTATALPSLRRKEPEQLVMLGSFGKLYTLGYPVDWHQLYPEGQFVRLPSYPWQRERYWNESEESQQARLGLSYQRTVLGVPVHPLLGSRLESPQPQWNATIDLHRLTYLDDHRLQGTVVYPGAAYVEMALAAAKEIFGSGHYALEDVEFHKALFLADEPSTLQLSVERSGQTSFNIHSQVKSEAASWVQHASGNLLLLQNSHAPKPIVLDEIRSRCEEITKSAFYQKSQEIGLEFGPTFKGIEQVWSAGSELLARIKVPEALEKQVKDYQWHPAVLDACFQVIIGIVSEKQTYLPVQIKRLRVYGRPGPQVWSHIRLVEQKPNQTKGDIQILDESGNVLVDIQGFCAKALGKAQEGVVEKEDYLYQYQWELKAHPERARIRQLADYLPSPRLLADSLLNVATRLSVQLGRPHYYSTVAPLLSALSGAYVWKALEKLGWQPELHQCISAETLAQQLGVVSQHHRLLGRMLEILHEDGALRRTDGGWEVFQIPELKEPQETWKELLARFPAYQAELMLLLRCGDKLAQVLRGEVDPLQLIFPEGSQTTTEHLYQDAPTSRIYNQLTQKAIRASLERLPSGRKVRILEIGAGTGSMTSYVLPVVPAKQTEYVFTDITQVFATSAKEKFSDYPFIEYRVLDIETDPVSQGFDAHSFDLILASNVLHATRDLRQTLENVKQLLASNGLLVLMELTNAPRWLDLTFGMLKGWWLFSDIDLRQANPLLSWQKWRDLLSEVGFEEVAGISDNDAAESVSTVILATGPQVQQETHAESIVTLKPSEQGSWLIFADSSGVGQQLADKLKERFITPILIKPGDGFKRLDASCFQIRPDSSEDMQQLLEAVCASEPACRGIVYLWSLDITPVEQTTVASLEEALPLGILSVLHLVQALERVGSSPRLVLVTRGAIAVGESAHTIEVAQSPLWGLGRVINNEFPNLQCTKVDISPAGSSEEIQSLFAQLWSDDGEDEIALRLGARYVHRLVGVSPTDIATDQKKAVTVEPQPFSLEISKPGILDNLTLRAIERRQPGPGEVEIQVCAAGLNFRDVAKAMNLLADVNLEGNFTGRSLGVECAGIIIAIGAGVTEFQIGDEVIACVSHGFSSHTTTDARLVVHKPAHISFEEAATIPAVFLTAYYSLHYLTRISKGERVLIHAAAGGVGLAAIQLAQKAGAEIFATTGSPEKREFLKALGVHHVMDSRSTAFADEVMQLTGGKGVDIVLNSLAGEAIPKSLSVLAPYGRFIEIGKQDIDANSKLGLRPFQNNLSFFAVDLDRLWRDRTDFTGSLLREVMKQFEEQTLRPLPHRVFPISKVRDAFRYMARALHIGKIVVSLQDPDVVVAPPAEEKVTFRPDGTYLITGGLGGFSLAVAQWLVKNGAKHLVLMGRSGAASPAAQEAVKTLSEAGAKVVVAKADVSQASQVADVLTDIEQSMPPLRGVIHAALVLDDGVLLQLNRERFQKVMAPKVIGAWNLHALSLNAPLDLFINFSSFVSTVGNPGQGNYVAASVFLDALAHHRRAMGLPALTVNWGVIADVGYVARDAEVGEHLGRIGAKPLLSQQALSVLGELLRVEAVQTAVVPINWQRWCQVHPAGALPRFSHLRGEKAISEEPASPSTKGDSLHNALIAAEPAQRQQLLESRLREQVARVLGTSAAKLDSSKPLTNLGLDSLMAVELSNRINNLQLGVTVSSMKLLEGISITQLATSLLTAIGAETETLTDAIAQVDSETLAKTLAQLEQLSEEEVQALLASEKLP
jgi:acyl transferase domain-containing protein/NADP-dependent 3-hydroxy acid dehydrogenase YdfG/phospholipid N-methyltransferase/aryl carrier-like protein